MKRVLLWTLITPLALFFLVLVLLYLPPIQNLIKNKAIDVIEKSTGMSVRADRLRLKFPITVEIGGLSMVEADGDTLISAQKADIDVAFWPLVTGKVSIESAKLNKAYYRLNTPDSAVYLTARIDEFESYGTNLLFNMEEINVGRTRLNGGDITLVIKDTVTVTPPDTTPPAKMIINAPNIEIRNLNFRMKMMPSIDSLGTHIGLARLQGGHLDMLARTISVGKLDVDSAVASYILPDSASVTDYPVRTDSLTAGVPEDDSEPWRISANEISLRGKQATYAIRGASPAQGLDMDYLQLTDIIINVHSFFSRGMEIKVPISQLSAKERCGLDIAASGTFAMNSTAMSAEKFRIATNRSALSLDALMGMGDLTTSSVPLALKACGGIALDDIAIAFPLTGQMLKDLNGQKITLSADISGTSKALDIQNLAAEIPNYLHIKADGKINNPLNFEKIDGKINIDGSAKNINFLKAMAFDPATASEVRLPAFNINGSVDYSPAAMNAKLALTSGGGKVAAKGKYVRRGDSYDATVNINHFPLQSFLPSLGLSDITASIKASGHGFDPTSPSTSTVADINIDRLTYNKQPITDVRLTASLDTCRFACTLTSRNKGLDIDTDVSGHIRKSGYDWDLSAQLRSIDLFALNLADSVMNGSMELYSNGFYNPVNGDIDAELSIDKLHWQMGSQIFDAAEANARLLSTDSLTRASLATGDFEAKIMSTCPLDSLLRGLTLTSAELMKQVDKKYIDVAKLQHTLPAMVFSANSGPQNVAARYISDISGFSYKNAEISLHNDSLISIQSSINGLASNSLKLDKITFDANQHGRFLVYKATIDNKPGTLDDFAHIELNGFLSEDKISALLRQRNIKDKQGFLIGFNAALTDSTINVHFTPRRPVIAYHQWQINPDNMVSYDFKHHHFDANLTLMSDSSSLKLYTEHVPDSTLNRQEDVVLKIDNIKLQDWLSISPFAPPVKGDLDANLRFRWDNEQLTGKGTAGLNNLYYGRERVGSFGLDINVANDSRSGALRADVGLSVDNVKVITASGNLNDSTAVNPFLLDFDMIHFPLRVVNPFLSKDIAQLSGMLNGKMKITGDLAQPIFNGFLDFDSTAVALGITGASYKFSEEKIPVDSSIVRFNGFTIGGLNGHDLNITGIVDARHLTDIGIDLAMNARDMQIVNSSRPRGASVYGKAFIDLDATVKGNMQFLRVDADLDLLSGTNVTYVMEDAQQKLAPRATGDIVHFVQFSDTSQVANADSIVTSSMAIFLDARLTISEGTTIDVDLSTDGKNKVRLNGSGNFTYSMTPLNDEGRLTGRYTINSGFVRYTPQISTGSYSMSIMSEKNFKFTEGSYVAFTGDILNPTLNIRAVDRLKANVTQSGQDSRLVNFDVSVSVTNTLENMNVVFDLSTDDDLTIQNELQGMSPDQRANQAMNMLLYNQYTGPGTKANANLSGNPLYSFLASQLNSWAASNIKGVDISFGIDQYDTTTDGTKSTTTSYSYRVSKTLFNDRFKIVVGGNYSTDADADENFSQNLINDISFEYMLNRSGSMYVKLFRHVGYESILEGEITQTGVGFVLKRKLNSLRDIFRFGKPKRSESPSITNDKGNDSSQNK